jgi:hypothetical protein
VKPIEMTETTAKESKVNIEEQKPLTALVYSLIYAS